MALSEKTINRAIKGANMLLKGKTVRQIGEVLETSKTTIYRDLTVRLPRVNPKLAEKVQFKLEEHSEMGRIRGGEVIKQRFATV